MKIRVGIVGGTGYTGAELLRLLLCHPQVRLVAVTSSREVGVPVSQLFPSLRGKSALAFSDPLETDFRQCDVVFFATPHGVAMQRAPALLAEGVPVIDLSADFRLKSPELFESWYKQCHVAPDLLTEAVYGLPEVNREAIRGARLVAVPGCYPTAVQLGLLPLLEPSDGGELLVDLKTLIADCKSGVSGAGRQASLHALFPEVSESFSAYGLPGHRHWPEIQQGLSAIAGQEVGVTFVPHLLPVVRGILATLYVRLSAAGKHLDLQSLYERRFSVEPFVDVMPPGSLPTTRSVRGANVIRLAVHRPVGSEDLAVILAVEDNLVKGASGQALQVMNVMFGLPEQTGLQGVPLFP